MNIQELLLQQLKQYPCLTVQDAVKALYQAAFGCEHLLLDKAGAKAYLAKEWEDTPIDETAPLIESLGNRWARVSLSTAKRMGLRPETIFALFFSSAEIAQGNRSDFDDMLGQLHQLSSEGTLPFSAEEVRAFLQEYRQQGCPTVRHSAIFRQQYHPAYRVIVKPFAALLPLLASIDRLLAEQKPVILGIDGRCASGKTSLAEQIGAWYQAPVFHMDDYFLQPHQRTQGRLSQPGGNVDAERFSQEILQPLREGCELRYRPYDCATQTLGDWIHVSPGPLAIVEGTYSLRRDLFPHYDLRILMDLPKSLQSARILSRNGKEQWERFQSLWIPLEEAYFAHARLDTKVDWILSMDANKVHLMSGKGDS